MCFYSERKTTGEFGDRSDMIQLPSLKGPLAALMRVYFKGREGRSMEANEDVSGKKCFLEPGKPFGYNEKSGAVVRVT